jgi:hypothetical protein
MYNNWKLALPICTFLLLTMLDIFSDLNPAIRSNLIASVLWGCNVLLANFYFLRMVYKEHHEGGVDGETDFGLTHRFARHLKAWITLMFCVTIFKIGT